MENKFNFLISKLVPKQVHIPYLGALYDLACKVFSFIGLANFMMLTRDTFYSSTDTVFRDIFGNYIIFMVACFVFGIFALLLAYVFLVPSLNKHIQDQSVKDGRSLMYEKLCEMDERMKKIEEKLN